MKKYLKILSLASALLLGAGCGTSNTVTSSSSSGTQQSASAEKTVVKLGIVSAIYEDFWAPAKAKLAEQGIDLQYVSFSDYVTPNNALNSGEIDLNSFQHIIYLEDEIANKGYAIKNIGYTYNNPLNLYSSKYKTLEELPKGAIIAIPNDATNGGRALKVLEAAGLIKLSAEAGFNPTKADITENTKNIDVKEMAANTIPSALPDIDAGIINGNYAVDFGIDTNTAIYKDTALNEPKYWNIIAARTKDLEDPQKLELYKKVVQAFQTPDTEKVFNEKYSGYFTKAGWDQNLLGE